VQRILAHRAGKLVIDEVVHFLFDITGHVHPAERVHRAFRSARIFLETFLQEANDRAFSAADRTMEQDDAPLGAVVSRGRLKDVHQVIQAGVDAVDRVAAAMGFVSEEFVPGDLLLMFDVFFDPIRENHVVNALERVSRNAGVLLNKLEVIL